MKNPYPIYASDLTLWKCPRALYHCAVNRDKKPPYDESTIERFNFYASLETVAIEMMKRAGWNVIHPLDTIPGTRVKREDQKQFVYKDSEGNDIMHGRVDLIASYQGQEIGGLYEIKTASKYIFDSVNVITDFIDTRYWWISGQLAQWCLYMYMSGKDYGGIVTVDRDSLQIFDGELSIQMKVHHASVLKTHSFYNERVDTFMHKVIDNIDLAWTGARLGTEPDFCNDLSVCSHCWAKGVVCHPPIEREGIDMGFIGTHSPDDIARMLELAPLAREYNGLKDKIEKPLKVSIQDHGAPEQGWIIGEGKYLATAKLSKPRKVYEMPDEIKKQYETEGSPSISISIESLETPQKID